MPFDWMSPSIPAAVSAQDPIRRRDAQTQDIRARAGLLQRLGRPQSYAVHRCLGNLRQAYELHGTAPLTDDEVRAVIADVYARRPSA